MSKKTPGQIRPSKSPQKSPEISDLPFYDANYQPAIYWRADFTGDYQAQCNRGMSYADATLDYITQTNIKPLLGWIVRDMITVGNFTGVEVGFFSKIVDHAVDNYRISKLVKKLQEQKS